MKENDKISKQELQCETVKDLLPIYYDEVVSDVTKQSIKEHLEDCESCRKEYREIGEAFPKEKEEGITKTKFDVMKKYIKRKQTLKTVLVSGIVGCLVVLIGYIALCVPIIPVNENLIELKSAHVIQTENGKSLFIVYKTPFYGRTMKTSFALRQQGDAVVLKSKFKRVLLAFEENEEQYFEIYKIPNDCKEVTYYNGEVIWSEGLKEEIPEYAEEFVRVEESGEEYGCGMSEFDIGITYDEEGRDVTWDFEGNIISISYFDDAKSKYFEGNVVGTQGDYIIISPFKEYWIADDANIIYVPMNTQSGQTKKDFEGLKNLETVGVYFDGKINKKEHCSVEEVIKIVSEEK